jgi:hypothetical protein
LSLEQILDKVLSEANKRNFRFFEYNIDNVKKNKEENLAITYLFFNEAKNLENKTQYMMPPRINLTRYLC